MKARGAWLGEGCADTVVPSTGQGSLQAFRAVEEG